MAQVVVWVDVYNECVNEWVKEMGWEIFIFKFYFLFIFFSKPVYTAVNCCIGNCDWKWLSSVNYGGGYRIVLTQWVLFICK